MSSSAEMASLTEARSGAVSKASQLFNYELLPLIRQEAERGSRMLRHSMSYCSKQVYCIPDLLILLRERGFKVRVSWFSHSLECKITKGVEWTYCPHRTWTISW